MAKKISKKKQNAERDNEIHEMENSAQPYITKFKLPLWKPIILSDLKTNQYIPHDSEFREWISNITNYSDFNLRELFWLLFTKKILKITFSEDRQEIYHLLIQKIEENESIIAFSEDHPNLVSTYYGLSCLKLINMVEVYFLGNSSNIDIRKSGDIDINLISPISPIKKQKLMNFLRILSKKHEVKHCLLGMNCSQVKNSNNPTNMRYLLYLLICYDIIGLDPREVVNTIDISKIRKKELIDQLIYLIILNYLDQKKELSQEKLLFYNRFEQENGSYSISKKDITSSDTITHTFWVTYLFDSYDWYIPYTPGKSLKFIYNSINFYFKDGIFSDNTNITEIKKNIQSFGILTSTLVFLFPNMLNKVEEAIFTNSENQKIINFHEVELKTQSKGYLDSIIPFINNKYQFTLTTENNDVRFRRYVNKTDEFHKKLLKLIYEASIENVKDGNFNINLNKIRKNYNKNKIKEHKLSLTTFNEITEELLTKQFLVGNLKERGSLLQKKLYFTGIEVIEKVIKLEKLVSIEKINREKARLIEIRNDIKNMNISTGQKAKNIHFEVESLILAKEEKLAQDRLRLTIKDSLFEASFFNENIKIFKEEFSLIDPKEIQNEINEWDNVYSSLQNQFNTIQNTLSTKIESLKEEKQTIQNVIDLEMLVNQDFDKLNEKIKKFERIFHIKIETEYSREAVQRLEEVLLSFNMKLDASDKKISKLSHNILTEVKDIKRKRKKIINNWVSNKEDFIKNIQFYNNGFSEWKRILYGIDAFQKEMVDKITAIGPSVENLIEQNEHKKAINQTETIFTEISEEIENHNSELSKTLDEYYNKSRKLYPLFHSIANEWKRYQISLEEHKKKLRDKFQTSINLDLNEHLKETFIQFVDTSISQLREEMIEFETQMSSKFSEKQIFSKEQLYDIIKGISEKVQTLSQEYSTKLTKGLEKFSEFKEEVKSSIDKWEKFIDSYRIDVEELSKKYEEELLIYLVLNTAKLNKSNLIKPGNIATQFSQSEEKIVEMVKKLSVQHRLNASIIVISPETEPYGGNASSVYKKNKSHKEIGTFIEVHNRIWRSNEKFNRYLNLRINIVNEKYVILSKNYEKSVETTEIAKEREINHIKTLSDSFLSDLDKMIIKLDSFVHENSINLEYSLYKESYSVFLSKIDEFKLQTNKIQQTCESLNFYNEIIEEYLSEINDIINTTIHNIYAEIDSRKLKSYNNNIKWLENKEKQLKKGIDNISETLNENKNKIIQHHTENNNNSIIPLLVDLEYNFLSKKDLKLQKYEDTTEDVLEKLNVLKIKKLYSELEDLIRNKQDDINFQVGKVETVIREKIDDKDFLRAISLMEKSFSKKFEKKLLDADKEIKKQFKKNKSVSTIFAIKYQYIIQKWELYMLEILNIFQEKETKIKRELIKVFLETIMVALNEKYIPIDIIGRELKLNNDVVKNNIISLISGGQLNGQIDMKYNLYLDKGVKVNSRIVGSLDVLRSKNVRAYLMITKISKTFRYLYPLIAIPLAIGSFFLENQSSSSSTQGGSSNFTMPLIVILLMSIPFILIYMYYQGQKKAIKGRIIIQPEKEKDKEKNQPKIQTNMPEKLSLEEMKDIELKVDTEFTGFNKKTFKDGQK